MKQFAKRWGAVAAMAVLALAVIQPATAEASTRHTGKFSVSAGEFPPSQSVDTASFVTSTTASGCVDSTGLNGIGAPATWSFALIWYDGGKNIHLFNSRSFTANGNHCSPTERITNGHAPKVYLKITVHSAGAVGGGAADSGTWSITTN